MSSTKYWIALEQAQGMGPAHLREIFSTLKELDLSIVDLFDLTETEIRGEFTFSDKIIESIMRAKELVGQIEEDYFPLLDAGISIVPFFAAEYPRRFFDTMGNAFPPILYTVGNRAILQEKSIAILGDKNVSEKGEMIAYGAARELARHHIVTASGFAGGVGMIAHRSAIENGGKTIAIVPYGILHLKVPPFIQEVVNPDRIIFVSPFYPTTEVNKFNAFIRNKIVCGLSHAVYIVEAPVEGGIFEAAKSAQKLGIPLYTTKYAEYPENAAGNPKILDEMGGLAIQRKKESERLEPNMDQIMAHAKFE